jgi:hypothetical protein
MEEYQVNWAVSKIHRFEVFKYVMVYDPTWYF